MKASQGVVAGLVACIWLAVGYRLLAPGSADPIVPHDLHEAPTTADAQPSGYDLTLGFSDELFALPSPVRPSVRRGGQPSSPARRLQSIAPPRLDAPPAPHTPVEGEIVYGGYVQAENEQPTAMLRYRGQTAFVREGGGVGPYRLESVHPDSARVLHTPSKAVVSLAIQL